MWPPSSVLLRRLLQFRPPRFARMGFGHSRPSGRTRSLWAPRAVGVGVRLGRGGSPLFWLCGGFLGAGLSFLCHFCGAARRLFRAEPAIVPGGFSLGLFLLVCAFRYPTQPPWASSLLESMFLGLLVLRSPFEFVLCCSVLRSAPHCIIWRRMAPILCRAALCGGRLGRTWYRYTGHIVSACKRIQN